MSNFAEAIESGNFITGSVCVDCLMGLANGEWPTVDDENWTIGQGRESTSITTQYDVTLGHMHSGNFDTRCWHHGRDCDDEPECYQECEQTMFSSVPCSVCGSHLAGSRDDVIMIERSAL